MIFFLFCLLKKYAKYIKDMFSNMFKSQSIELS